MSIKDDYTQINSITWDIWSKNGCCWTVPISHEEFKKAKRGKWQVFLTPTKPVPQKWFPSFKGKRLLGLASAGAQQMPIFAALGAECSVLDISDSQLQKEVDFAKREKYNITVIKGDMTRKLPFKNESMDIIFHPVSNCYVDNVQHIWDECYRILKKGGVLLAGFDNGINFLFDEDAPLAVKNKVPYNPLTDDSIEEFTEKSKSHKGIQFGHTLSEQLGGQLKAGFTITDLYEDTDRSDGAAIKDYYPQYMATRAVKL